MNMRKTEDYEGLRLQNQMCFPLYAASRLIIRAYQPLLEALGGITYPQYLVLLVLWEKDGQSVKEVSDKLYLDSGTVTPVLQKLKDLGLVIRKRSDLDDRTVLNFLTEKANALKSVAFKNVIEVFCNTGMTLEEVTEVKEITQGLIHVLLRNKG